MRLAISFPIPQHDASVSGESTEVRSLLITASRWGIGKEIARHTLDVTTQLGVRTILYPAQRCFRTVVSHLRYPHLKGTYYADTLFMNKTSVQGFTCANVIGNGLGFTKFWLISTLQMWVVQMGHSCSKTSLSRI